MKTYFYSLMRKYVSFFILRQGSVIEVDPKTSSLIGAMPQGKVCFRSHASDNISIFNEFTDDKIVSLQNVFQDKPDYVVISGLVQYERDIQRLLADIHEMCHQDTRLIMTYYSTLWRPLVRLASRLGLRNKTLESNWLAHEDVVNLLNLESFELILLESKILIPFYIPMVSTFFNRYLSSLPIFRNFCLVNIVVARPLLVKDGVSVPSVSIIVPARNEAGNINNIVKRIPEMGPNDEIIFVEGNSTDDTWKSCLAVKDRYDMKKQIIVAQQSGKGKGDAVRKGFSLAKNEILMILDADMTVPPEDLPRFYQAIRDGKGEFINGSRLVYPMEKKAMRFFNLLGNKFFAMAFSFVLGQRFKDTLCGTKVISRSNYLKLAENRSYFGDFDPFGDFDLIFGAARMGLKIIEVPISYRERSYGETNISRWRHGGILLFMLFFSARKIRFL